MTGPSLQTFEFDDYARSRKLSPADAMQLRAVFEERDQLLRALKHLLVDARALADRQRPWSDSRHFNSIGEAEALIAEICP